MEPTRILAWWIIGQLAFLGFINGFVFMDWANCVEKEKPKVAWITSFLAMALPLTMFASELPENKFCEPHNNLLK